MNCLKKRAMFITASFLGIGGYLLYQNLKSRMDELEEEIWDMKECEFESYPYCNNVYTREDKRYDDISENLEQIEVEKVKCENCNNELHDEVQNYLESVKEEKININKN